MREKEGGGEISRNVRKQSLNKEVDEEEEAEEDGEEREGRKEEGGGRRETT